MSDIGNRARELLVAEYTELGIEPQAARLMAQGHQPGGVHYGAVKAIIAALTPPEGYVLIQRVDAKRLVKGDTNSPGYELSCRRVAASIAARPEFK